MTTELKLNYSKMQLEKHNIQELDLINHLVCDTVISFTRLLNFF